MPVNQLNISSQGNTAARQVKNSSDTEFKGYHVAKRLEVDREAAKSML